MPKTFKRLIPVEEAQLILIKNVERKVGIEEVPVDEAMGRVVAEDIYAPIDAPSFDRATRDGFAVRFTDIVGAKEDKPARLRILGYVPAGIKPSITIGNGEAARIDTGAVIPKGADTIVPIEYCSIDNKEVLVYRSVPKGSNIQWAGGDIRRGELIVQSGTILDVKHIGGLAACGIVKVRVYRKPKVALFSIGNEIVDTGEELAVGKIYDINIHTLSLLIQNYGGEVIILGKANDSPSDIMDMLIKGLEIADIVVSTGASSVGQSDFVKVAAEKLGAKILFHGVMSKPGKPVMGAKIRGKLYVGLPGNPTSAIISFRLYVVPIILKMLNCNPRDRWIPSIELTSKEYGVKGRRLYKTITVRIRGNRVTYEPLNPASESISTLLKSDGYFIIPEDVEYLDVHTERYVYSIDTYPQYADIIMAGVFSPSLLRAIVETAKRMGVSIRYIWKRNEGALVSLERGSVDVVVLSEGRDGDLIVEREIVLVSLNDTPHIIATAYSISDNRFEIMRVGTHQSAIFRLCNGYVDGAIVPREISILYSLSAKTYSYGVEKLYVIISDELEYKDDLTDSLRRLLEKSRFIRLVS